MVCNPDLHQPVTDGYYEAFRDAYSANTKEPTMINTQNTLYKNLNEMQHKAVTADLGHAVVIAGAGSGKTRVLVHRIAHLIEHHQHQPQQIMAVTFTNKAAKHITEQLHELIGPKARGIWMGTFHHICHRMIRMHHAALGLNAHFTIIDTEDQRRLIKTICQQAKVDEDRFAPKKVQQFINQMKEQGHRSHQLNAATANRNERIMIELMEHYEIACKTNQVVDFSELLCLGLELLNNPTLHAHYHQQFRYLLVDEFQDSNTVQYEWLKALSRNSIPTMIVGDDDQSIYSWRGAQVENMLGFERDFMPCQTFRLEQNYRSTATILNAANDLIAKNTHRLSKSLWTTNKAGALIKRYNAQDETDEARYIVSAIEQAQATHTYDDMAILYRSNAQSRVLEEQITKAGLPYQIYGGLRFFERAEIKDALAYLRLALQTDDATALNRIINRPTRGIGQTTLDAIDTLCREKGCTVWQAITDLLDTSSALNARAQNALSAFVVLQKKLSDTIDELPPHIFMEHLIEHSGLLALYQKDQSKQGRAKLENLAELINASRASPDEEIAYRHFWIQFLAHTALNQGRREDSNNRGIQLMTLHAAKGLEFPYVFLSGMEEGLFPHQMTYHDPTALAEERRLCYVGMTRAMEQLTFTYSQSRRIHGQRMYRSPSRYLKDIPDQYFDLQHTATTAAYTPSAFPKAREAAYDDSATAGPVNACGFYLGQSVWHDHFGEGVVLNVDADQKHIQIRFEQHGAKWLVLAYANLSAAGKPQ
jgi:DNA helicase II / ATP-dependent DNA helicase PcrA